MAFYVDKRHDVVWPRRWRRTLKASPADQSGGRIRKAVRKRLDPYCWIMSYLHYVFPAVQWALPSHYHSIHKNELARAMVAGTQKAMAELQQKRSEGGAFSTPVIKSYEYSDMKPFFIKDDPKD